MTQRLFVLVLFSFGIQTSFSQAKKINSLVKHLPKNYEYQVCSDTSIINQEIKDFVRVCWNEHKNLNPFERIQVKRDDTLITNLYFFNDSANEEKIIKSLDKIRMCFFGAKGNYLKVDNYIIASIGGRNNCFNFDLNYNDLDCTLLRNSLATYFDKQ